MATGLEGLSAWSRTNGIHRIGQFPIAGVFMHAPSYIPSCAALATHALLVVVLNLVWSRLFGATSAVVAAAIFAVWPAGFEALLWSSCYSCIFSALCFWTVALAVLSLPDNRTAQWVGAIALFVLVVVATLVREDYTFCYLAIPALIPFIDGYPSSFRTLGRTLRRRPAALSPALAAFLMALLLAVSHGAGAKHGIALHLPSLVAVHLHQYTQLDVFGAWRSPSSRELLFASPAVLGLCITIGLIWALLLRLPPTGGMKSARPRTYGPWLFVASVNLGGALIYVLAGGYSLDSRKKYGLVPIILSAVIWCWTMTFNKCRSDAAWIRWGSGAVVHPAQRPAASCV